MNCAYHADREVQGVCSTCGRPVCEECLVNLNGQVHCKACLAVRVHRPTRDVRSGLRFALSLVPGLAHLYLGLFNRGLQFMVLTFVGSAFLGMFRLDDAIPFLVMAMIFYSVFDARECNLRMEQGLEVEDKGFVDVKTWKFDFNNRYIGYGLVGIGVLALYRIFMNDVLRIVFRNSEHYYRIVSAFNGSILGVLAILAGLWMLRRNFKNQ